MKSRIKVRTADLIAAIESRLEERRKAHEEEQSLYPQRMKEWQQAANAVLEADIKDVQAGDYPASHQRYGYSPKREMPALPSKTEKFDASRFARDLATLRMCPDETILISTEDYGHYLS